jgi:hypothetical protein
MDGASHNAPGDNGNVSSDSAFAAATAIASTAAVTSRAAVSSRIAAIRCDATAATLPTGTCITAWTSITATPSACVHIDANYEIGNFNCNVAAVGCILTVRAG